MTDRHCHDVAGSRAVAAGGELEVDETVVLGAPGETVRLGILLALAGRDEHLQLTPDLGLVLFERDPLLQGDEALVPLLHDGLRHLIGHGRRGRSLADGVLKGESAGEPRLLDDAHRVLEVLIGLTGEADDDVGRDRRVRDALAHAVEDPEEPLAAVRAAHRLEDAVGPRLQRHVQLRHDGGGLGHRVDDVVGEGSGVRAREADALDAGDLSRRTQELSERLAVAELDTVAVDVLTEKSHLDGAVVGEQSNLVQDVAGAAVLLFAAQVRHDAEGARVVAADGDRHPAAVDRVALGGQGGREDLERLEDLELGVAVVTRTLEQRRQRPHVVRAEDDIDPRRLLLDRVLIHLSHAAAHGDLHALVLVLATLQVPERAVELARGVVTDRAGVDDDDVGLRTGSGGDVAGGLERSGEPLGIVDVHLAAEGAHFVRARATVCGDGRGGLRDEGGGGGRRGHDGSIVRAAPRRDAGRMTGGCLAESCVSAGASECGPPTAP